MFNKIVAVCVATVAFGVMCLSVSCGSSPDSCNAQCTCEGKSKDATCLKACEDDRTTKQAAAEKVGCSTQLEDDESCSIDKGICEGGALVTTGSCDAQVNAYLSCLLSGGSTGTTSGGK